MCEGVNQILEDGEGFEIQLMHHQESETTLRSDFFDLMGGHETELKLKFFAPFRSMTIQTVLLANRHKGTFTKVLDAMKAWADRNKIELIIESVLSYEMEQCAMKNGFKPYLPSGQYIEVGSFFDDAMPKHIIFAGNYIYGEGVHEHPRWCFDRAF